MCKFCHFEELDDVNEITDVKTPVMIGNKKLSEHLLSMTICRDSDRVEYELRSDYYMDCGNSVATVKIPIRYCPFCGEELRHNN